METKLILGIFIPMWLLSSFIVNGNLMTSTEDIKHLLEAEHKISTILDNYITSERSRMQNLEEISSQLRQHSRNALKDPQKQINNIVSAFHTIKRFTQGWKTTLDDIHNGEKVTKEYIEQIENIAEKAYPSKDDSRFIIANLFRLQDTYALKPSDIAKGQVEGLSEEDILSVQDSLELGKMALNQDDFYHAILWLEQALTQSKQEILSSADMVQIYDLLSDAHFTKKNIHHAQKLTEEWLQFDPECKKATSKLIHYKQILENDKNINNPNKAGWKEFKLERPRFEVQNNDFYDAYESLCQGQKVNEQTFEKEHPFCYYDRNHHLFVLVPLKVEILSFEPSFKIFHDILSAKETKLVQAISTTKLQKSQVVYQDETNLQSSLQRVSYQTWMKDIDDPIVKRMTVISSIVSELNVGTVENLQVVKYGIGGYYEPHYDYFTPEQVSAWYPDIGNRIATVIFYLNDVTAGGATTFPNLGASVPPARGSCAVWYNLRHNGTADERTMHGACPVLTGTKWIATKWFREVGNEFTRKCDVDPLK